MKPLIFVILVFFLSCAGSVADPKSVGSAADAGVSGTVLDAPPAASAPGAGSPAASVVMPATDVKVAVPPPASGAEPGEVEGKPAPVDPVSSSGSPSGASVAVPATLAVPTH